MYSNLKIVLGMYSNWKIIFSIHFCQTIAINNYVVPKFVTFNNVLFIMQVTNCIYHYSIFLSKYLKILFSITLAGQT